MKSQKPVRILEESFNAERLLDHLTALTRVPSPQTELFENDPQVQAFIRDQVRPRVERMGFGEGTIDGMGNYVFHAGPRDSLAMLLVSYAMTHPPGSMPDPFSGKVVDGAPYGIEGPCVWGRGACEQKGCLVAMLEALQMVRDWDGALLQGLVFAVSTAGETGRHDSIARILKDLPSAPRFAVVGIGTGNRLCLANKGRLDVRITVRGRAGHSSMPWDGRDAIEGIRLVMDRLGRVALAAEHPHLGRPTLTKTGIRSGPDATHTVQDVCELTVDRRLLPGEDPEKAFRQIEEAVGEIPGYEVTVRRGAVMFPAELPPNSSLAWSANKASQDVRGRDVDFFYSHAAMDAGFLQQAGIEGAMWGPGDLRFAHTDAEVISIREVEEAARMYAALMLNECL